MGHMSVFMLPSHFYLFSIPSSVFYHFSFCFSSFLSIFPFSFPTCIIFLMQPIFLSFFYSFFLFFSFFLSFLVSFFLPFFRSLFLFSSLSLSAPCSQSKRGIISPLSL